ncbi:MAG: hypothetical protein K0R29_2706 [Pseudobdellovibrio sp.]|jgi:hypothetical protein|nr:hypothetical protein [Pseudobdellovibrio sp.]
MKSKVKSKSKLNSKAKKKRKPAAKKKTAKKNSKDKTEFHRPDYRTDVTEAELLRGLDEDLQDAWAKIKEYAAGLGNQRIYASGWAIMFSKKACYLFVRPKKKYLETCIFLPRPVEAPEVKSARAVSKTKYANMLRIIHPDQVDVPVTDWIQEAYEAMPE